MGLPGGPFFIAGCGTVWVEGYLALILVALAVALLAQPVARLAALYGSQFRLRGFGIWGRRHHIGGFSSPGMVGFLACCDASHQANRTHMNASKCLIWEINCSGT